MLSIGDSFENIVALYKYFRNKTKKNNRARTTKKRKKKKMRGRERVTMEMTQSLQRQKEEYFER